MDDFNEPFFNDPFFTGPAPMLLDSPSHSKSDKSAASNGASKDKPKEEKRVTKQANSDDNWGWLRQGFRTSMDVTEGKDNYTVAVDVPGVKPGM